MTENPIIVRARRISFILSLIYPLLGVYIGISDFLLLKE
ncbi:hypothetical protein SacN8_01085 [Sulfolobus acidocaldarius N8]|uniref:Uncharacterized protein n=2 Tax=Sulfolobus acidocaldarius TaxID=2285 RepID=M1I9B2_9CREN|nr:hypothetical protein SacN8_01085 [Sulfolobus acidocaldarius N8]AGE72473.1 hypothetical protein SacRon12I_01085 [Sulfolobus acidocaldarius Ron12/I]